MEYRIFLAKAQENIAAAECEYDHGRYNASANRAYYAMFHIAIAALLYYGFRPPGPRLEHKWVLASFNEKLVKRRKVYPRKYTSVLYAARSLREMADYENAMVSRRAAKRSLKEAKEFIEIVKGKLEVEDR